MDKNTLSNYGWIVIAIIIVAMLITLSIPLSARVMDSISNVLEQGTSDEPVDPGPGDSGITTAIQVRIESCDKDSIRYTIGAGDFDYVKIYKNEELVATIRKPDVSNGSNIYSFAGSDNPFVYGDVIKIECYKDLDTLVGSGVGVYNFKDGDNIPPVLNVITPQGKDIQNPTVIKTDTEKKTYTVTGTVFDDKGVKSVTVNGKEAVVKLDGTWSVDIELSWNKTAVVSVVAKDNVDNESYETRAVRPYTTPYLQKGTLFNANVASNATSVVFTNVMAPITATTVDVSDKQDGSVVAWIDGTVVYVSSQIKDENIIAHQDCSELFYNKTNLTSINLATLDTSNVTKTARMFYKCSGLTTLDLTSLVMNNVVEMDNMFNSCSNLTTLKVNNWNTGKVTSMKNLFYDCAKLPTLDISGWNTANVKNMSGMFCGCLALKELNLSNMNTQAITQMTDMFYQCQTLEKVILGTNFAFVGTDGFLPVPDPNKIDGATGKWYSKTSPAEYNPSEIPNNKADTYVAKKKAGKVELSATSGTLTYPNSGSFTITSNLSGGELSVSVADPSVATAVLQGTKVTVTPLKPGVTTTITVTSAATIEYRKATATYTLSVTEGILTVNAQGYSGTYDGNPHGITVTCEGATIKYGTSSGNYTSDTNLTYTDAGTYTVYYQVSKAGYKTVTGSAKVVINRAVLSTATTAMPSQNGTLTYNGSAQSPSWSNYDNTKMTLGGTTSGTNAGSYSATFTPTKNYQWSDGTTSAKTVTWKIDKASISTVPSQSGSLTYNGSAQSPSWNNYNSSQLTVSGNSQTNAGTYTATFTPTSNYKWSDGSASKTASWSIGKANGSVIINPTSGTISYGSTGTFSITSNSGNITVTSKNTNIATVSLSGTTVTMRGVGIGSVDIEVSVAASTNYSATSKTYKLIVERAIIPTVPSQSGTLTYNGSVQSPTWNNYNSAQLTISGNTGTDAGTYTAIFTPTSNCQWSDGTTTAKTVTWKINKASVTVPTQKGTLTYTGSAQSPSWNNYDTGKMTIGGTTSGTNATSYTATFTLKDTANYQWSDGTTAAKSVTWTIGKASISTVPSQNGSLTYNGSAQSPSWNNYNSSQLTISGNSQTNAGTYTATFTPTSNYKWSDGSASKTASWKINKASVIIPTQKGTLTYTGSAQSPSWNNYDTGKMTIGGTQSGTNATSYTATFTLKSTTNYQWSDGTTAAKSVTWTIDKASISTVPSQSGSLTYNGSAQSPSWNNYSSSQLTISGNSQTNAGTYTATFTPTSNYKWSDGSASKSASWSIGRATITTAVPTQKGTLTYTGSAQSPSWNNYNTSQLTIGGTQSGTNAGSYTATFTPTGNYKWSDGTTTAKNATWSIGKVNVTVPTQKGTLTYTGSAQSPSWNNYDTGKMTIGGTQSGTNATSYTATFTLKNTTNYQWSDGTTAAKSVSWSIGKASISTVPTQNGTLTYNGSAQTPSWNNYNSSQLTIGGTKSGTNAGTYTATFTPTSNYKWSDGSASKSANWSIGRATITTAVPTQKGTLTYTGSAQSPSWNNYNTSQLTIGGTTSGTNAGSYTATFTPTGNYKWSDGTTTAKNATWSIGKANVTVPTQKGTLTYTGSAQSPSWNNYDTGKMTIGGTQSGTNATSYTATFTLKNTTNYQWTDGTTAAKSVSWSIGKKAISTVPSQSGSLTYNGSAQTPSWNNYNSSQLTIGGTKNGTNAGTYTATFTPTSNYKWSDGSTSKSANWSISKANGSVTLSATSRTFNCVTFVGAFAVTGNTSGGTLSVTTSNSAIATASINGTTVTVTLSGTVGSATITVTSAGNTNYNAATATYVITVSHNMNSTYSVDNGNGTHSVYKKCSDCGMSELQKTESHNILEEDLVSEWCTPGYHATNVKYCTECSYVSSTLEMCLTQPGSDMCVCGSILDGSEWDGGIYLHDLYPDMITWTEVKASTCTTTGSERGICYLCGAEKTETIAATGHSWSSWRIIVEGDCVTKTNSVAQRICNNCGETETRTKGYSHDNVIEYTQYDANNHRVWYTCSKCGYYTSGYESHKFVGNTCTLCGYTTSGSGSGSGGGGTGSCSHSSGGDPLWSKIDEYNHKYGYICMDCDEYVWDGTEAHYKGMGPNEEFCPCGHAFIK